MFELIYNYYGVKCQSQNRYTAKYTMNGFNVVIGDYKTQIDAVKAVNVFCRQNDLPVHPANALINGDPDPNNRYSKQKNKPVSLTATRLQNVNDDLFRKLQNIMEYTN